MCGCKGCFGETISSCMTDQSSKTSPKASLSSERIGTQYIVIRMILIFVENTFKVDQYSSSLKGCTTFAILLSIVCLRLLSAL